MDRRHRARGVLAAGLLPAALVLAAGVASAATDTIRLQAGPGPLVDPASLSPFGTDGSLLVADPGAGKVWRISPSGTISAHYSNGAQMSQPSGVTALPDGGMVVADSGRNEVRRFSATGVPTTIAASLNDPTDVLPLAGGEYLIANGGAGQVVRVAANGQKTVVAGQGLSRPRDLSPVGDGTILVADRGAHRVFRLSPSGGGYSVAPVAGSGTAGYAGDGGPALSARLNQPESVAALDGGGFLVGDAQNHRIRRVSPDGSISTAVGTGVSGSSGDNGPATAATVGYPGDVGVLPAGGFAFTDFDMNRVRRVESADRLPGTGPAPPEPTATTAPAAGPVAAPAPNPVPVAPSLLPPAAPKLGERVTVGTVKGTVLVRLPGSKTATPLGGDASVPVGATVDATGGTVRLQSAKDTSGALQAAEFRSGAFKVLQRKPKSGPAVTDLVLQGSLAGCTAKQKAGTASASAKAPAKRRLWGSGKGRFRTAGRHAAATVRGTVWLTEDRCDGTLTRVAKGVVSVRELAGRKRTFTVRGGEQRLVRPPAKHKHKAND